MNLSFLKNKSKSEIFMCCCSLICFFLIFFLSSQSSLPKPVKTFSGSDKIVHAFAFGSLAFTFSYWFTQDAWKEHSLKCILIVFAVTACFGISDEIHQHFVKGRDSSVYDWFADCTGAVLACALRYSIVKLRRR
ncbi:VanZ family protein [Treponema pedis]|uniref:VanZ family protein n=1 Tax=Treponema pedis TaxID=409322 RepID=UPI0004119842|nr:VanZ family protein [Treponema pedis]